MCELRHRRRQSLPGRQPRGPARLQVRRIYASLVCAVEKRRGSVSRVIRRRSDVGSSAHASRLPTSTFRALRSRQAARYSASDAPREGEQTISLRCCAIAAAGSIGVGIVVDGRTVSVNRPIRMRQAAVARLRRRAHARRHVTHHRVRHCHAPERHARDPSIRDRRCRERDAIRPGDGHDPQRLAAQRARRQPVRATQRLAPLPPRRSPPLRRRPLRLDPLRRGPADRRRRIAHRRGDPRHQQPRSAPRGSLQGRRNRHHQQRRALRLPRRRGPARTLRFAYKAYTLDPAPVSTADRQPRRQSRRQAPPQAAATSATARRSASSAASRAAPPARAPA